MATEAKLVLEQAERIARSPVLQSAESLRNLLLFLARQWATQSGTTPKEHQIAMEVFHRPSNFDPRSDSTVRVQTSRLRGKLIEYYSTIGQTDPVVVEIPRGSYTLQYRLREAKPDAAVVDSPGDLMAEEVRPVVEPVVTQVPVPQPGTLVPWKFIAGILAVALLASLAVMVWRWPSPMKAADTTVAIPQSLQTFWNSFLSLPESPLIIYSNARFIGRPETGMRYATPQSPDQGPILDDYTGVGEVMAVHSLSDLIGNLKRRYVLKRSGLLNWDDTRDRNLIFVGSPSENLPLRQLAVDSDFRFEVLTSGPRKGDLAIINANPQPGEPVQFLASQTSPLSQDYAVVVMAKGPGQMQNLLLLAGTTTYGTQAAAEFVSRDGQIADLLKRLSRGRLQPFSAVLRVNIRGGVPIESSIAAFRAHSS